MTWDRCQYPADWPAIRARILERAGHHCERCGLPDHAVGYRDEDGRFVPNKGNGPCDASGCGRNWPNTGERLSYSEAKQFVDHYNDCGPGTDPDGNRWIVIVLTCAHLYDPNPMNCDERNLQMLCQRCHNRLDIHIRKRNARRTRAERRERVFATHAAGSLFELDAAALKEIRS